MNPDLRGQVALVTGAGRGIGRACARSLSRAGAAVALVARSANQLTETAQAITASGGKALAITADVADQAAVASMIKQVEAALGHVDLLVNNAGVGPPIGPIWECDPNEWWRNMEVNVRGPFLCSRAALPGMMARRRARIINVATGMRSLANISAYLTSKTALVRFGEILAAEVKPHGVQVFNIHPGTVRTQMAEYALNSQEGKKYLPWFGKIFADAADVGPERASALILFLASGQADALSGRYITVYDDVESLVGRAAEIERDDLLTLRLRLKGE
jgi:NAD(P)-dependent dehydrogenase (short-subunit alcohol dehydrogenase family)